MSSFIRRIQRKALRSKECYHPNPPVTRMNPDGSISVLRPTKGWLRTSAKRVAFRIQQAQLRALTMAGVTA